MDMNHFTNHLRQGKTPAFSLGAKTLKFAQDLDRQDELAEFRDQFNLPTRASLKQKSPKPQPASNGVNGHHHTNGDHPQSSGDGDGDDARSIYFVGNSLGAQPKLVREHLDAHLNTWANIGVNGHFTALDDSPLVSWQDMAEDCARKSVDIVGASSTSEVIIMNTLTANLHLLMASFYRPNQQRHKIILEWRPFPSDWYAIQTQIQWHGLDPSTSMVEIQPSPSLYLSTQTILSTIDAHADSTALLLLPGIQYYTGQLFDIPLITCYARERGIVVGWDLAHAAGNVELQLHDWDVDFAVWCTYKYLNAGPGAIAGAFVHERHGTVAPNPDGEGGFSYRHRLAGWYGCDKKVRFNMDKDFQPTPGAAGFQLSNPSVVDLASLSAALEVFGKAGMKRLRSKGLVLTAYLEWLLEGILDEDGKEDEDFRIITPRNPMERGSQLSLLLRPGLLEKVRRMLVENGVVCDARKPDVIRVAPVPMYCRFEDAWRFVQILRSALRET
ncbi:pyridoxal phosphate-dependent transferase [Immersiella caudata]|uniref:Kynureninase n=1 Tax=Immersiella caudata TaxID=314043 RepID=A0AA40C3U9_9PEZI|nr:pyridoxal phosphate-dependent transferase [Immersiella caudata]